MRRWLVAMDRMYGGGGVGGSGGVVMTRDPKPRLRWTSDLHDRFVDAVTKLGGPDSECSIYSVRVIKIEEFLVYIIGNLDWALSISSKFLDFDIHYFVLLLCCGWKFCY